MPSNDTHPILRHAMTLRDEVDALPIETPQVGYVYDYLDYAWAPFAAYITRYLHDEPLEALFLGMNPGPWGTAQTGVPFGEVSVVRDWMGIEAAVGEPEKMSPKRPITGFACTRSEVSGTRLWGWIAKRFGSAETFFARHFVWSYCPLMFIDQNGSRNITPDRLIKSDRERIFPPCDRMLQRFLEQTRPRHVVGIGAFAAGRARAVIDGMPGCEARVVQILHPSPASPAANTGWEDRVEEALREGGMVLPEPG